MAGAHPGIPNNEECLCCLANVQQSLQPYPSDENYNKKSPDPSKESQAECQDLTTNHGPSTVWPVLYWMATKCQLLLLPSVS